MRHPAVALTGLLLLPAAVAGCVTSEGATTPTFPWRVAGPPMPKHRGDLADARRLDLTYARWQEQLGNVSLAQESYERVLKEDPRSVEALLGLARLEQLAGRTAEAERAYRRAVAAAPKQPQTLDALGQFYADQERWKEAAEVLAKAAAAAPDDPAYRHHYAVALARLGRHRDALDQFARTVGQAEAHYNVGYILYEQGQVPAAEGQFRQAVALDPRLAAAHAMLEEIRGGGATLARDAAPGRVTQTAAISPAAAPAAYAPAMHSTPAVEPPTWHKTDYSEAIVAPSAPPQGAQLEQLRNQTGYPPAR